MSLVVMHLTRSLENGRFVVNSEAAVGHLSKTNERALQWFSINLVSFRRTVNLLKINELVKNIVNSLGTFLCQ